MEVDRFLYVVNEILDDLEQQEIVAKLTAVDQALKQLSSQPTAETEESFRTAAEQLRAALDSSSIDELVPSCQKIRDEMGAKEYTGRNLRDQIDSLINVAPFLAASVQKTFSVVAKKVNDLVSRLQNGKDAIEELGILPYRIPANEFELGILFPDKVVGSSLEDLLTQLKEWNDTLRSLAEAIKGTPGTVEIRSVSTGSFDLFISIDAEGALVLTFLIGGIRSIFARLQAAKERRQQLEEEGYSEDTLGSFDKDLERMEKEEIAELTNFVIKKYPEADEGRKRELLTFLEKRIAFIKDSVSMGVDIEVSVNEEAESTPDDGQFSGAQLSHATPATRRALSAATKAIADAREEQEKKDKKLPAPELSPAEESQATKEKKASPQPTEATVKDTTKTGA